ncbi:MAG: 23S rRNA (guanosine(2251)-2'-O)-methyltransferase RlmB [Caldilineae bacterium]|nr:23S rRNA (guanosine(2251)-2'-O)-methyltransferase RlmB [Chloroflexota bacterium]MCB9177685.1 23S rRNA (guanosine(2251)-2'-O)-methyltransferase RlmB [Caldilineae bacterium]
MAEQGAVKGRAAARKAEARATAAPSDPARADAARRDEARRDEAGRDLDPVLVYGRHPVLEALEAGESVEALWMAAGLEQRGILGRIAGMARRAGVPVKSLPRAALDRMAAQAGRGPANHQGVVMRLAGFDYADLDAILAEAMRRGEEPFLLVLDEIQDVHNLGSLIRTAEAAGVHGLLIPERRAVGVTAAVRKASAGAVAHLPVARLDLVEALDLLKARGLSVVGLDAEGELGYAEASLGGPLAIVVGSEGSGLRRVVARRCDLRVALPMRGRVASLNAAVAGSILLYEALRQRAAAG